MMTTSNSLPLLKKFFHCILSTTTTYILPIRNDNQTSPIKNTSQLNELTQVGAKLFHKASKSSGSNISGDFHVSTTLSFQDLSLHPLIVNWLNLNGYYMILNECQSSDMVKIGFLSRVRPFTWRDDLKDMIPGTAEWENNPFHFRFYAGSLSCNKKVALRQFLWLKLTETTSKQDWTFSAAILTETTHCLQATYPTSSSPCTKIN